MKKVDILETTDDDQIVLCSIGLVNGKVEFLSGDEDAAIGLHLLDGPIHGKDRKKFWPKDGEAFLSAMKYQYTGSIIRASDVYDG